MLVTNKILFNSKDAIGIFAHGTEGTDHALSRADDHDGQYQHVTELHPMGPVSHRTLVSLNGASDLATGEADFFDSLTLAVYCVVQHCGKLKWAKRALLITDGTSPCNASDEEIDRICAEAAERDVKIEVYGIDFDPRHPPSEEEIEADGMDGGPATSRKQTCEVLQGLSDRLNTDGKERFAFKKLSDAVSMIEALKKRSVRSATSFRGAIQIGPTLALPVWSWRKVVEAKPPSMKNALPRAEETFDESTGEKFDPTATVEKEVRQYNPKAPDVDVPGHMTVSGYRYGKEIIPVAGSDLERLKFGAEQKGLELIGVVPQSEVPRHLLHGRAECVVADPEQLGPNAHKALQAFMLALEEEELIGIGRFCSRKGARPELVALWPAIRSFWMCPLPFADEVRNFDWGPTAMSAPEPSAEQMKAASSLIDAMELCPTTINEEGEEEEAEDEKLAPKTIFNPKLQRYYQCIASRALASITGGSSTNLPDADWRVTRPMQANEEMSAKCVDALAGFMTACPVQEATTGSKRKGGAGGSSSGAGGDDETDAKRSRNGESPNKSGGFGGSGGGGANGGGNHPLQLTHSVPKTISTVNPVQDFWLMLECTTEDLVSTALKGMSTTIMSLLNTSNAADDPMAMKAYQCLREFRKGSVREDDPDEYNNCLKQLKAELTASSFKAPIWEKIVSDTMLKTGLITSADTEESEIDLNTAEAFWKGGKEAEAPAPSAAPPPTQDAGDDFLDDLE